MCSTWKEATSADAPQITRVLISQLESLEIWDSYTLSDWSPFWNQPKNEQLQTDNIAKSVKYFIFFSIF